MGAKWWPPALAAAAAALGSASGVELDRVVPTMWAEAQPSNGPGGGPPGVLHRLDLARYPLATCLDGSPGSFYFWPSPTGADPAETRKWIVWHVGGGWCSTRVPDSQSAMVDSCLHRSSTLLGSSANYTDGQPVGWTIWGQRDGMSEDASKNPMMHSWNKVSIVYCDGGSFSGRVAEPVEEQGQQLHFHGSYLLEAVIDTLLREHGLGSASDVVVAGDSAGGLSTFLHVDKWRAAVPKTAFLAAVPDSGFFLDWSASKPAGTAHTYDEELRSGFHDFGAAKGVNPACVQDRQRSGGNTSDCFFAENVAPFVDVPLFHLGSVVDSWQVVNELGDNAAEVVNGYRAALVARMNATLFTNTYRGGFFDACFHHTDGWQLRIKGVRAIDAMATWYAAQREAWAAGRVPEKAMAWWAPESYPCASCCATAVEEASLLLF